MKSSFSFSLLWYLYILIFFATAVLSSANNANGRFHGVEINVLAFQYPPIFTYKKQKNGSYEFGGVGKDILDDAKDFLNMSIKYVILDPSEVDQFGFFGAITKPLDRKEVDIVPFTFGQDLDNLKHMEIASALWISPLKIMQPWPEEQSRLKVTIRPLQLPVWLCFLGSTGFFIFVTAVLTKIKFNQTDGSSSSIYTIAYRQLEYVLKIITNQGYCTPYEARSSFKILVAVWLLCMVVLINAYSGVLTSLLTVQKLEPISNTMKELLESNVLRVTLEKNGGYSPRFLAASTGYEKKIGDQLRKDPTLLVSDVFGALENIVHHQCAYLGTSSIIDFIIREDTKANGRCRITSSPDLEDFKSVVLQMGFPIGSPYVPIFDEFFLRFWAAGGLSLYKLRYFPSTDQCQTHAPPKTRIGSLTLLDLSPVFFILGLGLSLSFLTFLVEILLARITIHLLVEELV